MRVSFRSRAIAASPAGLAMALALALASAPASAIEFGTASVMSGKGQRLKVSIPFRVEPTELISVTQFHVISSKASKGADAPNPKRFTISMPMSANILTLQSEELMTADNVSIVLGVAGKEESDVLYEFNLP